jgi:hypothetical protein
MSGHVRVSLEFRGGLIVARGFLFLSVYSSGDGPFPNKKFFKGRIIISSRDSARSVILMALGVWKKMALRYQRFFLLLPRLGLAFFFASQTRVALHSTPQTKQHWMGWLET